MTSPFTDDQIRQLAAEVAADEHKHQRVVSTPEAIRESLQGLSNADATRFLKALIAEELRIRERNELELTLMKATLEFCESVARGEIVPEREMPTCCSKRVYLTALNADSSTGALASEFLCLDCERTFTLDGQWNPPL